MILKDGEYYYALHGLQLVRAKSIEELTQLINDIKAVETQNTLTKQEENYA